MGIGVQPTSGMRAAKENMEVISNNIANANTVGFKKSTVNFADVHSSSLASTNSAGLGVKVQDISQDFSGGRIETTGRGLDLSIGNNGFIIQKDPSLGITSYTRAGRLELDGQGYLNGLGGRIQGYPAVNGEILTSGALEDIQIPDTPIPAKPTSATVLQLNLDANSDIPSVTPFDASDASTYNFRTDATLYDSLGNPNSLSVYYVKTADNSWTAQVQVNDTDIGTGNITFGSDGLLSSVTGLDSLSFNPGQGAAAGQAFEINLTDSTQFGSESQIVSKDQNGNPSGIPTGFNIDKNGVVNVFYSNGDSQAQGQIALATFKSPESLTKFENMSWINSSADNEALVNANQSSGAFSSGTVELSNVDLTEEMVRLLGAQHDFQANAQAQQVFSQALKTIENLG